MDDHKIRGSGDAFFTSEDAEITEKSKGVMSHEPDADAHQFNRIKRESERTAERDILNKITNVIVGAERSLPWFRHGLLELAYRQLRRKAIQG